MDKHNNYNADFFLSDNEFVNWVRSGKPMDGTRWEALANSDSYISAELTQARQIIEEWQNTGSQLSEEGLSQGIGRVMSSVAERNQKKIIAFNYMFWLKVAAMVLFTIGLGWVAKEQFYKSNDYSYEKITSNVDLELIEVVNNKNVEQQVFLPDGSTITLSKGSQISYSKQLINDSTRNVYLKGDAFFEVTKDKKHPFLVYTNGLITRVVGTSFKISSQGMNVSVAVRTGKVAVYSMNKSGDGDQDNILLAPNQEAIFAADENTISRKLVEQPVVLQGRETALNFNYVEAPVVTVFDALEKAYGIQIAYDPEVLKNCTITIPFRDESFYKKLDIICRTIQATYEISENEIMIISKGCN